MNSSYGDSTNSARGRARISGSAAAYDSYDGYDDDPYASVGSSATGRASVTGRAGAGAASTGRASVRSSYSDDFESDDYSPSGGGGAGVVGRAIVAPPGDLSGFDTPNPPWSRRRTLDPAERRRRQKRARRRNILLSAFALMIMLTGIGVVGGTYYFGQVPLPKDVKLPQSTTIYYADGKHQMARFGDQNRTIVTLAQVSPWVPKAVVATEDNTFYTNSGVSIRGILRALWNNLRGGRTQGGSTIAQQYARQALDSTQTDRTISLKVKEAVVAMKLEQKYSKNDIMQMYLNIVYFGRGAYGIQAAAQAYFGTDASKLTPAQAMVLAEVIKSPSGGYDESVNPAAAQARFDSYVKPNMVKMGYLTQQQADQVKIPPVCAGKKPPAGCLLNANTSSSSGQFGLDKPTGLVEHHALDELTQLKNPDGTPKFNPDDLKNGGYKIITTVDYNMEKDALQVASRTGKDSLVYAQKQPNLQAALVSVEPKTGRVKAYYGGDSGVGTDYAGCYNDRVLGASNCAGHHPPGSTAKAAVLATALSNGYSLDSWWNGISPRNFAKEDRIPSKLGPVTNSGGESGCGNQQRGGFNQGGFNLGGPNGQQTNVDPCMLWQALANSINTVFYAVGEKIGPENVLNMWHSLGLTGMWARTKTGEQYIDFTNVSDPGKKFVPSKFTNELSIGQFPISVTDNATVYASLAGGVAVKSHFVQEVDRDGTPVYHDQTHEVSLAKVGLNSAQLNDETWALEQVHHGTASGIDLNGRGSAVKTGTWQQGDNGAAQNQNGDAWFCGFTPAANKPGQLSTCVWVGNVKDRLALKMRDGSRIFGATLPGPIWEKFMNLALQGRPVAQMPGKAGTGSDTLGELSPDQFFQGGNQGNGGFPGNGGGGPGGGGPGGGGGGNGCQFPLLCPPTPQPTITNGGGGGGGGGGRPGTSPTPGG